MSPSRTAIVAVISALVGAGGVLWWKASYTRATSRQARPEKPAREVFVPAQQLSITDGKGTSPGYINLTDGLATMHLYTGGGLFITASIYRDGSRILVQCLGAIQDASMIVDDDRVAISSGKRRSIIARVDERSALVYWLQKAILPSRAPTKRFDDTGGRRSSEHDRTVASHANAPARADSGFRQSRSQAVERSVRWGN